MFLLWSLGSSTPPQLWHIIVTYPPCNCLASLPFHRINTAVMRLRTLLRSPLTLVFVLLLLLTQLALTFVVSKDKADLSALIAAEHDGCDDAEFTYSGRHVSDGDDEIASDPWWQLVTVEEEEEEKHTLEKRRGGGGHGGGGGGGGGGRGGGGKGGGGGSGGSGGRTSSYAPSRPRPHSPRSQLTSPQYRTSNVGGRTISGSGTPKSFGGAYGGGAAVPYKAGGRSASGIVPAFLGGAALGVLPGLWLSGAHSYQFSHPVTARNNTSGQNETLPVLCLCQEYSVCGCDENHNATYTQALYNNASVLPAGIDKQFVSAIADVNGTKTLVVNGTLANGTTADGGTDDGSGAAVLGRNLGVVVMVLLVVAMVNV